VKLLFEDAHLLIVDKPAGLMMHPSWLDKHETDFAQARAEAHAGQKLHTLHRLDRPTSGILLFGKHPEVARRMMTSFQRHEIDKYYLCIARGWTPEKGRIDKALKEEVDAKGDRRIKADKPAQEAITRFVRLGTTGIPIPVGPYDSARYSLVLARPITGRLHQIRKHFRKTYHHLIGDTRYGDGRHNAMVAAHFGWQQLALRCVATDLVHPMTGQPLRLRAGLTPAWQQLCEQWGWQTQAEQIAALSSDFLHAQLHAPLEDADSTDTFDSSEPPVSDACRHNNGAV